MNQITKVFPDKTMVTNVSASLKMLADLNEIGSATYQMLYNSLADRDTPFIRSTCSTAWIGHYFLNGFAAIDPVLDRVANCNDPFFCSDLRVSEEGQAVLAGSVQFGVGASGYSIPCHDADGRKAVLSLNSFLSKEAWYAFIMGKKDTLKEFAEAVHRAAIAENTQPQIAVSRLSPRETECLHWVSKGKTYMEIAQILDLSDFTVRDYLKLARLKLDSVSLSQAVAKALLTKLI